MDKYSEQNKIAWEYNAYDFWVSQTGTPSDRAKKVKENPRAMLKRYSNYFIFLNVISEDIHSVK